MKIWRHETDVPARKHGAKILRCLTGAAEAVCDEIDVDQLLTEQGADLIISKLKEYYQPHLETSMPKAFEKAVYGEARKNKESFSEFILRQDAAYRELAEEGVKLSDDVKGYVMFRQGNLSQTQEDQVTTWTQGSYDRAAVIKAFRRLDKVHKEKGGRHFASYEGDSDGEFVEEDGDSEEFVYLGEGDLQQVYEEEEIQEALATYQQVRKAIKDQKVSRGYFGPRSNSSAQSSSGGKGGGKSKISGSIKFSGKGGGTKVHIDLLKLRTKCARCGQLGHWARECVNEPDGRGKKSAGDGSAAKSGFFEICEGEGQHFQVTLGQCMKQHEKSSPTFISSPNVFEVGVVDTAAQGGLVGRERLQQLEKALQQQGLKIQWLDKKAQARGIGGEASVCGVAQVPIGVAGVNGLIEVTVVEDKVPLLLSIKFLKEVEAVVNLVDQTLTLNRFGKQCSLTNLETGHIGVNVMHFAKGGWKYPHESSDTSKAFHFWSTAVSSSVAFMSNSTNQSQRGRKIQYAFPESSWKNDEVAARRGSEGVRNRTKTDLQLRARRQELACGHGKGGRSHGASKGSGKAQHLARRWLGIWMSIAVAAGCCTPAFGTCVPKRQPVAGESYEGGNLCRAGEDGNPSGSQKEQGRCQSDASLLHSPGGSVGWGRQPGSEGDLVQGLPQPVAGEPGSHEPDPGKGTGDTVQWQGIHLQQPSSHDQQVKQGKAQCKAFPEEPHHEAEEPHLIQQEHRGGHPSEEPLQGQGDSSTTLHVRQASNTADRQERRSNTGKAVLEVHGAGLPILRMGSGGGQNAPEEGTSGEGGCRDDQGRKGSTRGEGVDGAANDGCSRGAAQLVDERGEGQASAGNGADEEPTLLACSCGRRGEDGGDVQQSHAAATNDDESSRVKEADDGGGDAGREQRSRNQQWHVKNTLSQQEMDEWLIQHAPRACFLKTAKQWDLWAKRQIEERQEHTHLCQVTQQFWIRDPTMDVWHFHHGILPNFDHIKQSEAIGIFEERGLWQEVFYEEPVERALSKSSRKGIQRHINQMVVAEVFSPPRVCQVAKKMGHVDGGSFDLKSGYDLSRQDHRRKVKRHLRQVNPDLLVICPPCGPFSVLQNLNIAQHGKEIIQVKLAEGREHLEFGMELYEWQVRRDKMAIFEHPSTSAAWNEEAVQKLLQRPEVRRVRADQCEYGLAVKGISNKKPTDFMVNTEHLARKLSKRCQGQHKHQPLMGGLARLAQEYPEELCKAMIQGAEESLGARASQVWATEEQDTVGDRDLEDLLDEEVDRKESVPPGIQSMQRPVQDEQAHEDPAEEEEAGGSKSLTKADMQMIHKLHCNLGHPGNVEFAKALRLARARGAVWRYVKEEFRCPICERNPKPKPARPATLPRGMEPCRSVGIDVVYFPGLDVRKATPVLNMTDLATGFQMLEPLDSTLSNHIWEKFYSTWVRVFSMPETILLDQGREFGKDFATKVNEAGCHLKVIGARAPWQQGRTECHGGLAKEVFTKLREEILPTTWAEWKLCIHAVEAAKNRMYNKSGFSPAQRQIGYNLRLPGNLGSEDAYDPVLVVQSTSSDMQRLLDIKHKAMEAFIKHTSNTAIHKASKARTRTHIDIKPGDIVYVYRVPLQRRRKAEEDLEDKEGRRATWVGPGAVVMTEGANAWLSIRGEVGGNVQRSNSGRPPPRKQRQRSS